MNLKPFTGPGSTPSRRRFWDQVTNAVIASRKVAGRNVSVDEHPGKGSVINIADTSSSRHPIGPGGGTGTGACCFDDFCDIETKATCEANGGSYQGNGTVCDPNPCCSMFVGCTTGLYYQTRTTTQAWSITNPSASCGDCSSSGSITTVESYNENCVLLTVTCSGSASADCGGVTPTCSWNLVGSDCVLEPTSDCPEPFTLWQLCTGTGTFVNSCVGDVYTQTWTPDSGTGNFVFTQILS